MTDLDEHGRPEPPFASDETATLLGFLECQRATLAWKCSGLDAAGLSTTVAASSMTLGGILKHLAYVEEYWFAQRLHGRDRGSPWDTVDWDADPDWDWHRESEFLRGLSLYSARSRSGRAQAVHSPGRMANPRFRSACSPQRSR